MAQTRSAYPLRKGTLDARPAMIALFKSVRCFSQASILKGFMFKLRTQRQATSRPVSTARSDWTSHTDVGRKLNTDNRRTMRATTVYPTGALLTSGTNRRLSFPIQVKLQNVEGHRVFGLPTGIWTHGSEQINAKFMLTIDQVSSIHCSAHGVHKSSSTSSNNPTVTIVMLNKQFLRTKH